MELFCSLISTAEMIYEVFARCQHEHFFVVQCFQYACSDSDIRVRSVLVVRGFSLRTESSGSTPTLTAPQKPPPPPLVPLWQFHPDRELHPLSLGASPFVPLLRVLHPSSISIFRLNATFRNLSMGLFLRLTLLESPRLRSTSVSFSFRTLPPALGYMPARVYFCWRRPCAFLLIVGINPV